MIDLPLAAGLIISAFEPVVAPLTRIGATFKDIIGDSCMAPFTGGMMVFNAALIGYAEACILLLFFGVWPGFLLWLTYRKVLRPWLDSRQPVVPYVHVEPEPAPEAELNFPGADRIKVARAKSAANISAAA